MNYAYALASVIIVSFISIIAAVPLIIKRKVSNKTLLFLLSVSVGVLLATVFISLLPESFHNGGHLNVAFYILGGFLAMFLLEKFVHYHHTKKCETEDCGHGHAYSLAPVNLIGDGIHNFVDGLVIAGSYAVSVTVGITATISIIFHEIPQEIADFGVLLYSGLSKAKAVMFNLLSALTSVLGALLGFFLIGSVQGFTEFIIPFAAGNFTYIAASNLVPQLHRHCKLWDTVFHIVAILIGIAIIALVAVYGPGHAHG